MQRIPDVSGRSLVTFVCNSVEPGSRILTDSWRGYNALQQHGYKHKNNLSESGDPAHVVMPGAHRISSLLKRWIIGTLQGYQLVISISTTTLMSTSSASTEGTRKRAPSEANIGKLDNPARVTANHRHGTEPCV